MKASVTGVRTALAVVAALVMLGACAQPVAGPGSGDKVGELVDSWSQADSDSWVDPVMPISPVLLASEDELEEWLITNGGTAEESEFDALREVDLSENFLVIGGYSRCQESSTVLLGGPGEVMFEVVSGDEHIACVWSPYTIDAFEVPLAATGGSVPKLVG